MGFLKSLFRFFSGSILLEAKKRNELVIPVKLRQDKIEIGNRLSVDKGYSAVVICRQKVTDVFSYGEHKLKISTLPYTDRRINLNGRIKKHKNYKLKFPADIYYVNLCQFSNEPMRTNLKATVKDKEFKTVNFGIEGSFTFQIEDPEKFVNTLLLVLPRIKNGQASDYVNEWVTVALMRLLERENKAIEELRHHSQDICVRMTAIIDKKMSEYGIRVSDIKIYDLDLPKRIKESLNSNSANNIVNFEKSEYILGEETQNSAENYVDYYDTREKAESQLQQINNNLNAQNYNDNDILVSPTKQAIQCGNFAQKNAQMPRNENVVQEEFDRVFGNLLSDAVKGEQSVQNEVFLCKNCGAKVTVDEFYCHKCGRLLD
ncbi:MAG: SPFH domain-containing protein [Clostridia bacterium]|jgi:membrane protease subunit (stomatin/prohibitin family)|nr:SPFH domain-containing protein [Clostridia bacterium]MDD4275632.1 SPFH domain-containing protein [Clostridia bacterium]